MDEETEENGPKPWEQLEGESHRAHKAFCVYRDRGPTRGIRAAALAFYGSDVGRSSAKVRTMERWSVRWGWRKRVEAFDQAETLRHGEELAKERKDSRLARLKLSRLAMLRAEEKLLATKGTMLTVNEAVRLMDIGMKNERLDLGEPSGEPGQESVSFPTPGVLILPAKDPLPPEPEEPVRHGEPLHSLHAPGLKPGSRWCGSSSGLHAPGRNPAPGCNGSSSGSSLGSS